MKTSEFTDKEVTELSRSHSDDFSDEDSDSSFRFRPRRPDLSYHFQNRSSMDYADHGAGSSNGGGLISMIDRKMEEHSKNLLHAVEGLNVRLCQLDTRTRKIEDSVEELKDSTEFNHGRNERKLKGLEQVLTEVQVGIRDLRDKQEISEAQTRLTKLQIRKSRQESEDQKTKSGSSSDHAAPSSIEAQSNQLNPGHHVASQQPYPFHQTPSYQNHPTPIQTQSLSHNNQFPSVSSSMFSSESTNQQFSLPMLFKPPPLPTPSVSCWPCQPIQLRQPHLRNPSHGLMDLRARDLPPVLRLSMPPPPLLQPRHFPSQSIGENPHTSTGESYFGSRSSEFLPEHMKSMGRRYGFRPPSSELRPPSSVPGAGGNNVSSRPPKAKESLPRALPMATEVNTGSDSGGTGSSIPVDDVINNIAAMGFRRDLVRATVKKMTENGQSVDPNVVLDKLMKSGEGRE